MDGQTKTAGVAHELDKLGPGEHLLDPDDTLAGLGQLVEL